MAEYTQEDYSGDYGEHLSDLTPEEAADRKHLGGVFVGLLTQAEWQERDAEMRHGMSDANYEAYLKRCRMNTVNVERRKAKDSRQLRRFFEAEALGVPHHGASKEHLG